MNPSDPNIQLIEAAVRGLGDLCDHFVFVGGSTTGLLITDDTRPPARATQDVDAIIEVVSLPEYYQFHEKLEGRGFLSDPKVFCRWRLGELKVDIMPTSGAVLGFTNRWYPLAAQTAEEHTLPSATRIRVISPPLFVATKIEAFHGRGNEDYGASHDMEDIVTVVDGRVELVHEIAGADPELRNYIIEEFDDLLARREFVDSLAWHLPPDAMNQARLPEVIQRLRAIAGI